MATETNDPELVLRAHIQGIRPDEVKVAVEDGVLEVSGEHREEHEENRDGYIRRESRHGLFAHSVTLPPGVEADDVKTSVEGGTVKVEIVRGKDS